jgi:uncharacterized protein YcfJ
MIIKGRKMKNAVMMLIGLLTILQANEVDFSEAEYVKVFKSTPIYSDVRRRIPHEVCEEVMIKPNDKTSNNGTAGAIVGGIIGGVLGHQIGGGSGNTAATIGGATIGTLIGHNAAAEDSIARYEKVRRCSTQYEYITEKIITGYTNFAHFKGKDIAKVTSEPIKEIKITHEYSF